MDKHVIYQIVQEEVQKLIAESKDKAPSIQEDLEKLRKKFHPETLRPENLAMTQKPQVKRVAISTVSELLNVPVSDLMLYFLNNIKASNDRHLVEYHLGEVHFFAE